MWGKDLGQVGISKDNSPGVWIDGMLREGAEEEKQACWGR